MKKILLLLTLLPQLSFALTGLKVGEMAPALSLVDTDGVVFELSKQQKPLIMIFYRGAWCPYCIKQLKAVQSELVGPAKNKADIIAISVDQLKIAKKMKKKFGFSFKVLSDPKAKSLKAFKIVNQLKPALVKKYKSSYRIDIEGDSGETHHMIAHPAVYIIKNGKITFADIHINYKERTKNSTILENL